VVVVKQPLGNKVSYIILLPEETFRTSQVEYFGIVLFC
jgi:hypothetical protein